MAHFAVLTMPDAGHLVVTCGLAAELQRRGHSITFITYETARQSVERRGFAFVGLPEVERTGARRGRVANAARWLLRRCGLKRDGDADRRSRSILTASMERLRELRVDAVIADQNPWVAGAAASLCDLPYATLFAALPFYEDPTQPPAYTSWSYRTDAWGRLRNAIGYRLQRWNAASSLDGINAQRRERGLPPLRRLADIHSPLAQLCGLVPELDFPRPGRPDHFHYVGPLGAGRTEANVDFPWDRLDGRPLVYASLGTIKSPKNARLYRKIAAACAGLDVQLVLALGRWAAERGLTREALGDVAGDPLVVEFAPQLALLEKASAFITHAGANSVVEALLRGTPMVALPRQYDQPGMAARVAATGAALQASFQRATVQEIRAKLLRVLHEPSFREQARRVGDALARAGGPPLAADIVERRLLGRNPDTAPSPSG